MKCGGELEKKNFCIMIDEGKHLGNPILPGLFVGSYKLYEPVQMCTAIQL